MRLTSALVITATAFSANLWADNFDTTKAKLLSAMESDIRTDKETARDKNRLPVETLEFFGLRDDMKVVEFIPGGGWYTKLLAPVMAEKGEYHAALGTSRISKSLTGKAGFEKMNITKNDAKFSRKDGARFSDLAVSDIGVKNADMVFTFRNYHNLSEIGREAMNKAAFEALKPGGIYAVVDHTARHMEASTNSNRRRFDPVKAIIEIQAAGFEFVDYSDLHYREDDELRYEVGSKSVTGNSDRWTLKFRKTK